MSQDKKLKSKLRYKEYYELNRAQEIARAKKIINRKKLATEKLRTSNYMPWSDEEVSFVQDPAYTIEFKALKLKRSYWSVANKIRELKKKRV